MKSRCMVLIGVLLSGVTVGCTDGDRKCEPVAIADLALAMSPYPPASYDSGVGMITVASEPTLRFPMNTASGGHVSGSPDLQVQIANNYSSSMRKVQVDLRFEGTAAPYSELRISWNSAQAYSYRLVSYEMRVSPSSKPGVTLVLDVIEPAEAVEQVSPATLGVVSAWSGHGNSLTQQGPGVVISDSAPFWAQSDRYIDYSGSNYSYGSCN